MKVLLFSLTLVVIVSCRKDEIFVIKTGQTKDLLVTDYDKQIIAQDSGFWKDESKAIIDLDNDGVEDLLFYFTMNQYLNFTESRYSSYVKILNPSFSIAEISGSGQQYKHIVDTVYDVYGTFPRMTVMYEFNCDSINNIEYWNDYNNPYIFEADEFIDVHISWDNQENTLNLGGSSFDELYYYFNSGGDSLHGYHYYFTGSCNGIFQNESSYITFRKQVGSSFQYGWIELFFEPEDKLTITRSAISKYH